MQWMNSIWIRDFFLPPQRCVWARLAGMLPALHLWGFYLADLSEWGTGEGKSAHQKSETEIFKNSYKELNSPSAQYQPGSVFCLAGRTGSGVPHWLPLFREWFLCLTSFQHSSVGNPWHCTTKPYQQSYSPHQYYHSPKKAFILSSIKLLFTLYLF